MRAALFFRLLAAGRRISERRMHRQVYLERFATIYPDASREGREEIDEYLYTQSLAPHELELREIRRRRAIQAAEAHYSDFGSAMGFFKARGLNRG